MHKKTIGIITLVTIAFIFVVIIWGLSQSKGINFGTAASSDSDVQADVTYFYGKECPHCINVEKFIEDNKVDEKISFAKKEVWHDEKNNTQMQEKAKECGLEENKVGVPFVYARGKCYVGEIEVTNFLKKEIGLSN